MNIDSNSKTKLKQAKQKETENFVLKNINNLLSNDLKNMDI